MKRLTLLVAGVLAFATSVSAQQVIGKGQISGSFESSSIYYTPDPQIYVGDSKRPEDSFGSNNYIKVDYANGRFSAGVQMNAFLPALVGFDALADGYKFYLASKYVQWRDKNYEILVGDIFDQFGNGLIFRSFEDRQLGINNSLEGVRAAYSFGRYVTLKGMYGRPRLYTEYSKTWVRGADLSVSIADIANIADKVTFNIEGSYVNRFQSLSQAGDWWDKIEQSTMDENGNGETRKTFYGLKPNLNMYSARMNFGWNGLTINGEYVGKGNDVIGGENPYQKGWAALGEVGYSYKTFSVMGTVRALKNMGTRVDAFIEDADDPINRCGGNAINYLPALTRQYTYMLANLNPYEVKMNNEIGGQIDVCYSYRSKSNRYRYWNFHANFSTFYSLDVVKQLGKRQLYWRDINVDVERQWDKKWKSLLLYSYQDNMEHKAHIFVGDVTHKFNRKMSLRFELQYLLSGDKRSDWDGQKSYGDWVAALVEFSLAPHWSFYVQDMYNLSMTKMHYYNGGFSYTHNRTRVQLSYGRNRAGYICSGGVCRYSPGYTGVNLVLTSSF